MARQSGRPFSDLKEALLGEGHAFSLCQVLRLLRLLRQPGMDASTAPPDDAGRVSIRPKLSLAFPPADVDRIEEEPDPEGGPPRFRVTANLLGLYGVSSPLPTFYTEDLIDEANAEESVSRDFIDIVNHRLFVLFFRAWAKNRQFLQVAEEGNSEYALRLFALLGLGEKLLRDDIPEAYRLIRYLGLLTQFPRSAMGLSCLLQDAMGGVPVKVVPCVVRTARIPPDQRLSMGMPRGALGVESYIGEEVQDRMGRFRIRVGPLSRRDFQSLLPGGEGCQALSFLTHFYLADPLEYELELVLAAGEAQTASLGDAAWSRLGLDTWIFSKGELGEASVRAYPE